MTKKHKKILLFFSLFLTAALFTVLRNINTPTDTNTHANASTSLTFTNASQGITPGGTESVTVMVNPGNNAVSLINLIVGYDSTKLTPTQNGFVPNTQAFTQTLDGPIYNTCTGTQCTMYIALSVGSDPTKAIKTTTQVATLNFQAVSAGSTQLTFDNKTQVFSVAATDKSNENVLSTATPSTITIAGSGGITPTIIEQTPVPTVPGTTFTPTPTLPGGTPTLSVSPTNADTPTPSLTDSLTPSPTPPSTSVSVELAFPGIGINGGNLHPLRPIRNITFYLYNVDNGDLITKTNSVVFDGSYFTRPTIDLGPIPDGNYQIFIRSDQFLTQRLTQGSGSSTITVQNGQPIQAQPNQMIAGDIAPQNGTTIGDNILDIYDYNALLSCYGARAYQSICPNKQLADLDDNGVVDAIDYNIMLRGFALTHRGDTIPRKNQ